MMEQTPVPVLKFKLENLKELIQHNSYSNSEIDGEIKNLIRYLDRVVKGYTRIDDSHNDEVLQKLRKVVVQAEVYIEGYIIHQTLQQNRASWSKALHLFKYLFYLRQIRKHIKNVRAKAKSLYQEKTRLSIELEDDDYHGSAEVEEENIEDGITEAIELEDDDHYDDLEDGITEEEKEMKKGPVVVGFEDEAESVIELLTGESEGLEIISIIGMNGLGKTTLAMKVLNDPQVEYEFFPILFVNVSRECDKRVVFINILHALKCEITPNMPQGELVGKIQQELGTNKYLIVLDDVCTTTAWDDLKVAFPNNEKGSRVLITTRHKDVASHANQSENNTHALRFRTYDESRELLRRNVFRENACPPHLKDHESRILKKCCGIPLAIVVVAGILFNLQEGVDGWEKVVQSLGDNFARDESQLSEMIKSSFHYLPYHLKACFSYFGVLRENFEIPVWKLVMLWIAEGFIQKDGDMTLEDIADDYLEDLVDRNLVMVGRRRSNGQIKTCRIHHTLRDLCKETEKFDQTTILGVQNIRRRPVGRVRSCLTSIKVESTMPFKDYKLLRVLDVKSLKFNKFPQELIDLVLLKYIAMLCDFEVIPEKFSNLKNLQTVIIDTISTTVLEIAADISKLVLLRHLLITNGSASLGINTVPSKANENLQTLSTISPESCTEKLFESYPNLKKLGIRGKLSAVIIFYLFECLAKAKLQFLENLKLINDDDTCLLGALPPGAYFPRNLRRLTLKNTSLAWSKISTLGKLRNLEVLKLKDNAFDGGLWKTEDGGFPRLKVLHIGNTQKFKEWKAEASHFPKLTSLYLSHCAKLKAIPNGIADIPSLQLIDLYYCTIPSLAVSARKIQVLKLQQEAQQKVKKTIPFNLVVYPPDQ